MKPYNEYKSTKHDWMGSIPVHWDAQKIRELFTERKEKVSDKDYAPLSVSRGGVVPQISTVAKSNDGDNRKLVRYGDFAINSRSDRRGSSGLSVYDGSVSLINIVLCPRASLNGRYTHYLLKSHFFIEEYYRNGRGIVADLWTTRYAEMKSIVLPVPPREEQDQIVRYLDWQVSKTNKLISALKKQIALLKEQKQAVINEAVTKGLDPNVPMKDSGVEWIGEIPVTWEIVQLRRLVNNVKTGGTPQGATDDSFAEDGYRWYTPGDFSESLILGKSERCLTEKGKSLLNTHFPKETVMLIGIGGTMGKVSLATEESSCNQQINAIVCNDMLKSKYLVYFLRSIREHLYKTAKYTTLPIFNQSETKNVSLPRIPVDDQNQIIEHLDVQCAKIDAIIENINRKITVLAEYRTRLISDVVTGQIDVRDIEVPEFEYIADEADDASDDENIDAEEMVEEGE